MIQPGKLRHSVTIQKLTGTLDAAGQEVQAWETYGVRWAAIEPLQGRELFSARQIHAEITTRITVRYLAGVTPKMRVLFGSRTFDIQEVINPEERNAELQLMCIERV
jgi:SPP1 family predicted phage head-tail adaptor